MENSMKRKTIYTISAIAALIIFSAVSLLSLQGCEESYSLQVKGEEYAKMTYAPMVPPPITRNYPTKVIVKLETTEVTRRLSDGVDYTFWTFGGDVPGKFIRVREGDLVEFHLANSPDSKMPHNIDLHAVTGPGGGATSSFTAPGHSTVFSFTAANPGLYVYHCATAPVGLHVANGMYGLMLVEPKEGLPPVDKEYYIMQSEFYTEGKYGEPGYQPFSQDKAVDENPAYVVFNGSVGSLTGDKAIPAKVGETVRLYVGNGGPNLVSSFHVIGEIFDNVYGEGGTVVNQKNVQTTLVPAGGSTIVEFKFDVPGTYILVDHSIFRAFNKGAIGMINVTGEQNLAMYSGKIREDIYLGSNETPQLWEGVAGTVTDDHGLEAPKTESKNDSKNNAGDISQLGKNVFTTTCAPCHQANGEGIPNVFPPLAKSDFLNNKEATIKAVISGLQGQITVNGKTYNGVMPPQNLSSDQIAAVLTYVYKSWGNSGKEITKEEVEKLKGTTVVVK
jgi:nitrite reductase (NO-forming)